MGKKKGKLKIFFGYCAGVGKTYSMLEAAHAQKHNGIDVIIGYVERHDREDTNNLIHDLETIPVKAIHYKDTTLYEFDVDAALKRNPQLILVDELAHTNAFGSRHPKRYSDIQELLHAGIDVYTTLNVQHIESLQDIVAEITRIRVHERIPDKIFDQAEQVELIDIEPEELRMRLQAGKIYKKGQAQRAMDYFFSLENLIALREIALRRCADRVNTLASFSTKSFTKEHILICLSSSPSNALVIRTAARMASAFHGEFTALYVETTNHETMDQKEQKQFDQNCELAQQLGASIVSVYGEDIARQIIEFAKISSVSKLVIGRSYRKASLFAKPTLVDELTSLAPDINIYIIPNHTTKDGHNEVGKYQSKEPIFTILDTLITLAFLGMATLISFWFYYMGSTEANIIMIYILAIVFIAFLTKHKFYGITASILIVFMFNYCFTEPRFSFEVYAKSYPMTFFIMLIVAIITNTLARKSRMQNKALALHAHRMEILLEISQNLQRMESLQELAKEICLQLYRLLHKTIIVYSVQNGKLQPPFVYNENLSEEEEMQYTSANEQAVALWVLKNNKKAGVSTNTLTAAKGLYFAVRKQETIYAIIGIAMRPHEQLPPFERSMLTTVLNEIALVMDSLDKQTLYKLKI